MLSKKHSLPSALIPIVLRPINKRIKSSLFNLVVSKKKTAKEFQIALIVAKKTEKKANRRNKMRRKIQQALLQIKKEHLIHPVNLVLFPKKEVLDKDQKEIKKQLVNLFLKEEVISK